MIPVPSIVAVGLLQHGYLPDGRPAWVVTRRHPEAHLGGAWELPGGKVEPDETPSEALVRELAEELGVTVTPPRPLTFSHFRYEDRTLLLLFYETSTTPDSPQPRPLQSDGLRLLPLEALVQLPMPPANEPLLATLRRRLSAQEGAP